MGTRRWTLSTFVGCCIWILQGLRAAAAVPVTTEGPITVGTASPIAEETEWPHALGTGTAEMSTTVADAEIAESILERSSVSPTFPPGSEMGDLVTTASSYVSTIPTLTNATKPLNPSQENQRGLAAPTAAMTAASISTQLPALTPEAEHDVTGPASNAPPATTLLSADVNEDVLVDVAREGADLDPTVGDVIFPSTFSQAITWGPQPTAGSPMGTGVTVLLSQGLDTATGVVKEGVTLPVDIQSEDSTSSSRPGPGAGTLLITQEDGAMSRAVGITPDPLGDTTLAATERPLASVPGDAGDAVNGAFSTADASHLPPESVMISGTVGNPGESSLLPGQAALSSSASLTPAGGGDGQGAPGMSSDTPGSSPLLAVSEVPAATVDKVTSLLAPGVPIDAQSDMNAPVPATVLPTGYVGAVDLAEPSLQPAPRQNPAGEQPRLLPAALPFSTDTSSSPGAAYPPPGTGDSTLPATDHGTEMPGSPDLAVAPGAPMSPSVGRPQPWGMAADTSQGTEGPGTGLNSVLDAPNPTSFIPDGLSWPSSGVPAQGTEGAGETAQSGGPGDGSPYVDTQTDMSRLATSAQKDLTNTGEMPAGGTEALANAEMSSPSALGDGAGAGAALARGPAPPGSAGLEPDLLGAEGPGHLPGESPSAPGVAHPPPGAAAETPVSPNLGAAQGVPVPPSLGGPEPWEMAAGAPQGAGLPGANGPSSGLTSAWDGPSSASYGPAGLPSPALGHQLDTNPALPAVEGLGAGTTEQALGGVGSATGFDPSLSAAAGSGMAAGMDQLPGAGSPSGPASLSDPVATSSVSADDGAGPIQAASPGTDSLSPASLDSETLTEFPAQGTESTMDVAEAGNPESESPYMETSPSAFNAQQDATNTGEMPAGGTEALANTEMSSPSALGGGAGAGAGAAPALGQVSPHVLLE
ncbi:collagen alpha-1(I) chain-like [Cuculus canorus]|uniref:collagen alpha-1(I) chain-like n=1 Tax=Cuculus canorus TaxID=55661 RepID=UPI0023AAFDBE|nr:collagen alpha-1(I) chain-like [Cuculus canorus]